MLAHRLSGAKLRAYREAANRSIREVAHDARLSEDYLYKLEVGRRQPSRALTHRLAAAVNAKFDDLLADEDPTDDSGDAEDQKAVA